MSKTSAFVGNGLYIIESSISVATITFWVIGYGLMYGAKTAGFISLGSDVFFNPGLGAHDVFFQTVFAATAATIVSGAIAGRAKYSTYILFTVVMTAIIYPISGGWQWQGSGWLTELGFIDFAGSSIVHGVGGFVGTVLVAFFGSPSLGGKVEGIEMGKQLGTQLFAAIAVAIFTIVVTFVILKTLQATIGLKVEEQD